MIPIELAESWGEWTASVTSLQHAEEYDFEKSLELMCYAAAP